MFIIALDTVCLKMGNSAVAQLDLLLKKTRLTLTPSSSTKTNIITVGKNLKKSRFKHYFFSTVGKKHKNVSFKNHHSGKNHKKCLIERLPQ